MTSTCFQRDTDDLNGDPVGGLVYAFGAPVVGGFELRVLEHAAQQIVTTTRV
jgi:hypothetical protein